MDQDFDKWLVSDLKNYLLQHDIVLEKGSGKNGNVIKSDLVKKAYKIYKSNKITKSPVKIKTLSGQFPTELNDLVPNILNNVNMNTVRSLNKQYYASYPAKRLVYDYIISNYEHIYMHEDEEDEYFNTIEEFKMYEQQQINMLDDKMVDFLFYMVYLMKNKVIYTMDIQSATPYLCNGFFLYKSKILLIFGDKILLNNHSKGIFNDNKNREDYIYQFINDNFDEYYHNRMVNYYFEEYDIDPPTYNEMMLEQKKTLSKCDNDMIKFLLTVIDLINREKMIKHMEYVFDIFKISSFIFMNEMIVFF
jgi:hypothetical protein